MVKLKLAQTKYIFLISLCLLIFSLSIPQRIFSEQSTSKFDRIETPPMPGQAYRKSGEKAEDSESLPPAVRKMDEQIKRETKVLRRGLTGTASESDSESESPPKPSVIQESRQESRSGTVRKDARGAGSNVTTKGAIQRPVRTKASVTTGKDTRTLSPTTTGDKAVNTVGKKSVESQKPSQGPSPQKNQTLSVSKPTSVKTEEKVQTGNDYEGITTGGKAHNLTFFLKRLIIFAIIAALGFLLIRKYVLRT